MKIAKIIAILLVVCILSACGTPVTPAKTETGGQIATPSPAQEDTRTPPPEIVTISTDDDNSVLPSVVTIYDSYGHGIAISVHPAIQLAEIISFLANDIEGHYANEYDLAYKDEVTAWFSDYKNSEIFTAIKSGNFPLSMRYLRLILYCMNPDFTLDEELLKQIEPEIAMYNIDPNYVCEAAAAFCKEANFAGFYKYQYSFYNELAYNFAESMSSADIVSFTADYFGTESVVYHITILPLTSRMSTYTFTIDNVTTEYIFYTISGAQDGAPTNFNENDIVKHISRYTALADMIPADEYLSKKTPVGEAVMTNMRLWRTIGEAFSGFYGEHLYDEMHMNHYIEYYLQSIHTIASARAISDVIDPEEQLRFCEEVDNMLYVREIYDYLEVYEQDREAYPDFDTFLPDLIYKLAEINGNK